MRWSDERILTTHTGSLPRPPELTRLYVRRARGEAIDPAELDRLGKAALRQIVDKQIAAGVDVGNNGEQMREMLATREAVGNYHPPKAIGEVRYVDDTELKAECADFRAVLNEKPGG